MPLTRCQWCGLYHDVRSPRCREIQKLTEQLDAKDPRLREQRLLERIRKLKYPDWHGGDRCCLHGKVMCLDCQDEEIQ